MGYKLKINLLPKGTTQSRYDWMNIDREGIRVGKVRGRIDGRELTIFSINIFPEFEKMGYAKAVMVMFKQHFESITADRVRYTAVGFWKKMGFSDRGDGSWIFETETWRYRGVVDRSSGQMVKSPGRQK